MSCPLPRGYILHYAACLSLNRVRTLEYEAARPGAVMPFWYIASLLLTLAAAWQAHSAEKTWETAIPASALLQIVIIVFTVTQLAPLNARIAKWPEHEAEWLAVAKTWDKRHVLRVFLLLFDVALLAKPFLR